MTSWAYLATSSGRHCVALPARSASAASRVNTSTSAGRWVKKLRMIFTCPSPISPAHWAAAVAVSNAANGAPVNDKTLPQVLGFGDTPAGFGFGDPQPVRQRRRQRATQVLPRPGSGRELIDQRMLRCPQTARSPAFQTIHRPQQLRGGQGIKGQTKHTRSMRRIERVKDLDDLLTRARNHTRILLRSTDKDALAETWKFNAR